jgi:hypothetical protein
MCKILNFLTHPWVSTVIAGVTVIAIAWVSSRILKWWRDRRDSEAILTFLTGSTATTDNNFRSTEAIASHTKLTAERVEALCARHPKIRRNRKEKESWTLED